MWLSGFSWLSKDWKFAPWHCTQSPVAGWALSRIENVVAEPYGRVWKPKYCVVMTKVFGLMG